MSEFKVGDRVRVNDTYTVAYNAAERVGAEGVIVRLHSEWDVNDPFIAVHLDKEPAYIDALVFPSEIDLIDVEPVPQPSNPLVEALADVERAVANLKRLVEEAK